MIPPENKKARSGQERASAISIVMIL